MKITLLVTLIFGMFFIATVGAQEKHAPRNNNA